MALYVVRVPQAGVLPTASFRFHLTMDTLAVQLMVATAKLLPLPGALETPRASPWHLSTFRAELDALRVNSHSFTVNPYYSALRVDKILKKNGGEIFNKISLKFKLKILSKII